MPQIRQYQTRTETSGPTNERKRAIGSEMSTGAGWESLGKSISNVGEMLEKRAEQQELSDLNAKLSEVDATHTKRWQDSLSAPDAPNDPQLAEKFVETLDQDLNKIGENAQTRAGRLYFQTASANLKGHFQKSANAGQSHLAGVKAVTDYQSTLNNQTSSLIIDPDSFGQKLEMHGAGIDNLVKSGMLDSGKALQLKQQGEQKLADASVRGWVDLNPEYAKEQLKSGRWDQFIEGDHKAKLLGLADQEISGRALDARRVKSEQEEARKERLKGVESNFLTKLTEGKGLTAKEINRSDLDPDTKRIYHNMLEQKIEGKIKTNPNTYIAVWDRIHLPDGDPNKITDEAELNKYMGRGMTPADIMVARGEIAGTRTIEGRALLKTEKSIMDIAKNKLTKTNPMFGIKDAEGDELYVQYQQLVRSKKAEQIKAGKPVEDLFKPESPDYVLKYLPQRSIQDIMRSNTAKIKMGSSTPLPPEKLKQPDETIEAWRKRTKGS